MRSVLELLACIGGLCLIAWFADRHLPHECRWCSRDFPNRPALNDHLRSYRHHCE